MPPRVRPSECCPPLRAPAPLPAAQRARLAALFQALGDPTRLEVFRFIAAQPAPVCVCDIVDRFSVTQPTISHHLRVLREAGLVTVTRRGVWAYYAATRQGAALLVRAVEALEGETRVESG